MRLVPEELELVHGGEAEALPNRSAAGRGVADVGDDDALLLVDVLEQGGADRDVPGSADDRVVGIDAQGREEGVHRAAHALVQSRLAAEDFREGPVDQVIDRQIVGRAFRVLLDHPQAVAAKVAAHHLHQRGVIELLDGGKTLGQNLAVAAVAAVDVVVHVEQERLADGGRLLADREVRRALVVVFHALEVPTQLYLVEHVLERADELHVVLDADQVLAGIVRQLVLDRPVVLIDRDRLELNGRPFSRFGRADHLALGHGGCFFL